MVSIMSTTPLLVTGASGHLGRRVLELLLERGAGPIIATTRTPASLAAFAARGVDVRRADFEDDASLAAAFAGARRALLISTDAIDRPGRRVAQHRRAIAALERAGVAHVVYTSLPNPTDTPALIAPDHAATEAALAETKLDWTVLRNNMYTDYLLPGLPGAIASGTLIDAKGTGAVAYVTRDDCARAAAGALAGNSRGRTTIDVTGPEAVTPDQLAAIVSELTGVPIRHTSVPAPALIEGMVGHGLPRPVAELLASFDAAAAKGDLGQVSPAVEQLWGEKPTSVAAYLRSQRAALTA
jgi:NAD(P)H dehydrogenase (quinone)